MTEKEIIKNNQLETKGESSTQAQQKQEVSQALITQKLNNIIALKEQDIFNYLPLKEENGELKKQEVIFIDNQPWYETEYKQKIIEQIEKEKSYYKEFWEKFYKDKEEWEKFNKKNNTPEKAISGVIWQQTYQKHIEPLQENKRKKEKKLEEWYKKENEELKNRLFGPLKEREKQLRERERELLAGIGGKKTPLDLNALLKRRDEQEQKWEEENLEQEKLLEEYKKTLNKNQKEYFAKSYELNREADKLRNEANEIILIESKELQEQLTSTGEIAPLQLIKSNLVNYQQEVAKLAQIAIEKVEEREKNWEKEKAAYEKELDKKEGEIKDFKQELDEYKELEQRAKERTQEKIKKGMSLESQAIVNLKQAKERIEELECEIIELEQNRDDFYDLYEASQIQIRSWERKWENNEKTLKDWEEAYLKWDAEKKEKHNKILKLIEENGEQEKLLKGRDRTIDYWANEAKARTETIKQLNQEKEELTREKRELEQQLKAELAEAKNQAQQYLKEAQEYGQEIFNFLPAKARKGAKIVFWIVVIILALWALKYLLRFLKFLLRIMKWIWKQINAVINELKSLLPASKSQEKTEASKDQEREPKIETVKNFSRNSEPTETNKSEPATENKEQPTGKK